MDETHAYIANAFSIQMLDNAVTNSTLKEHSLFVHIRKMSDADVRQVHDGWGIQSAIGHKDTAAILTQLLGFPVEFNRQNIHIGQGDMLIVAQVTGGRLPEGATTLPEGMAFEFFFVELVQPTGVALTNAMSLAGMTAGELEEGTFDLGKTWKPDAPDEAGIRPLTTYYVPIKENLGYRFVVWPTNLSIEKVSKDQNTGRWERLASMSMTRRSIEFLATRAGSMLEQWDAALQAQRDHERGEVNDARPRR